MDPLATLTRINLDDLVAAFGWQDQPVLSRALRFLFLGAARRFAQQMLDFDHVIGRRGLVEAARMTESRYVKDVRIHADRDPSQDARTLPAGPVLALSNHPGLTDTLALFCALDRPDLKVIALDRPFLAALPNMSDRLFFMGEDATSRIGLVRRVSSQLRAGGAVLTFPAGQIEPDPDVYPGAAESLQSWTASVGVFVRMAPETVVVPVLVRNVISYRASKHPLLRLRRTRDDREILAAALQLLGMILWNAKPVQVTVQIGRPITVKDMGSTDTQAIQRAVTHEMQRLIANRPRGEGTSAL